MVSPKNSYPFLTSHLSIFIRERCTVNRVGFLINSLSKGNYYLSISYFLLIHLYSVDGVGGRCRSSENPSMRGDLLRVSGRWSLSAHLFMRERFSLTKKRGN